MNTRLCVGSDSTHVRYIRSDVIDCARLFVGNSIYFSRGDYNLCVTGGNAAVKHLMLGAAWQRSVWVTISKGPPILLRIFSL